MVERSAGAIIFRMEKGRRLYLLLHYEAGHWEFVKGHLEHGEETKATVRREAEEEAGLKDLKFFPGFKETVKYFLRNPMGNILKFVVFFLAETKTKDIRLSFEHQGFAWLPYEEAMKQLTYKNAKELLRKANDFLENLKLKK